MLCVLRTLTKTQGRTAYIADLPYPVGSTTKVSFPEKNETTASFCLDFNSSNDSFLVASERALSTDKEEYFVAILLKTNNKALYYQ